MRTIYRALLIAGLAVPTLTACSGFDLDKLDVFGLNEKKKLPGERKDVFPGGVPGVTQGIPPEYMRGNQPATVAAQPGPAEQNKAAATSDQDSNAAAAEAEPKPKPKRAAAKPRNTAPPAQQAGQPAAWPEP